MTRIESRGVRCLECRSLDLQRDKEAAKTGFGWCPAHPLPHYVAFRQARNCVEFAPDEPEKVAARDAWGREAADVLAAKIISRFG